MEKSNLHLIIAFPCSPLQHGGRWKLLSISKLGMLRGGVSQSVLKTFEMHNRRLDLNGFGCVDRVVFG